MNEKHFSKELQAPYYFDLSSFSHASLFQSQEYVWNALKAISPYLNSKSLGVIEIEIPDHVHLIDRHLISIGKGSVVEPGAYIKGPCIIGENCTIRHGAYIRGDVYKRQEQQVIETGLRKCGAIIGDYTQIGCHCVLNPGTHIGRNVSCYPLKNLSGFTPSKSAIHS